MIAPTLSPQPPALRYAGGITIAWLAPDVERWRQPIERSARRYDVNADLIAIIISLESAGRPGATSPAGAQGLMQVMPDTAQDIAGKFLLTPTSQYDIYDPATNIEFGTAYLAYLRNEFGRPDADPAKLVRLVAAGYNGGPGAANRLEQGRPGRSKENIDYAEGAGLLWRERAAAAMPYVAR